MIQRVTKKMNNEPSAPMLGMNDYTNLGVLYKDKSPVQSYKLSYVLQAKC
jgi:hypothetical protein